MRNTNTDQPGHPRDVRVQEFLDMIAPSVIKFNTDWIVNTFLDNFFKIVLPVLYRGFIS